MKKWKLAFIAFIAFLLVGCSTQKEEVKTENKEPKIVEFSKLSPSQKAKVEYELIGEVIIPKDKKDSNKKLKATFDLSITNNSGKKIKYDMSKFKVNNSNLNQNDIEIETLRDQAGLYFTKLFSGIVWKDNNKLTYKGVELPVKSTLVNREQVNNWMRKNSGQLNK